MQVKKKAEVNSSDEPRSHFRANYTIEEKRKQQKLRRHIIRQSKYYQFFAGWGAHLFFQTLSRKYRLGRPSKLWACGRGDYGQLSLGNKKNVYRPVIVELFSKCKKTEIVEVSVGYFHSLFLTATGPLSSGKNSDGQLSDSTLEERLLAVPVLLEDENAKISSVVAGLFCSYFLTIEGLVFAAGKNYCGELGLGYEWIDRHDTVPPEDCFESVAVMIKGLSRIVQIVTGDQWVLFRSCSNELFGCGRDFGQFGTGIHGSGNTRTFSKRPVEIEFFKEKKIEISFVVAAAETAFFVTSKGQVYLAGQDIHDTRNGSNKRTSCYPKHHRQPILDRKLSDFQIFCSGNSCHFAVVKKNNRIYGSGYCGDRYGNLKLQRNGITALESPILAKDVMQIVTRKYGTYVICRDGSIFATGYGREGQMMNSRKADSNGFVFVGKYRLKTRMGIFEAQEERIQFLADRCCSIWRNSILLVNY